MSVTEIAWFWVSIAVATAAIFGWAWLCAFAIRPDWLAVLVGVGTVLLALIAVSWRYLREF